MTLPCVHAQHQFQLLVNLVSFMQWSKQIGDQRVFVTISDPLLLYPKFSITVITIDFCRGFVILPQKEAHKGTICKMRTSSMLFTHRPCTLDPVYFYSVSPENGHDFFIVVFLVLNNLYRLHPMKKKFIEYIILISTSLAMDFKDSSTWKL